MISTATYSSQARQDAEKRVAAPFVALLPGENPRVLGYYTLSAPTLPLGDLPDAPSHGLNNDTPVRA